MNKWICESCRDGPCEFITKQNDIVKSFCMPHGEIEEANFKMLIDLV